VTLAVSNRRMRIRMSGGVEGALGAIPCAPIRSVAAALAPSLVPRVRLARLRPISAGALAETATSVARTFLSARAGRNACPTLPRSIAAASRNGFAPPLLALSRKQPSHSPPTRPSRLVFDNLGILRNMYGRHACRPRRPGGGTLPTATAPPHQYHTCHRNSPCGGAVGTRAVRGAFSASSCATAPGGSAPCPMRISSPTMLRT